MEEEKEDEKSVVVILPAAGSGTRMGISKPKQFCLLQGRPVISHTIRAFEQVLFVKHIIVVVAPDCEKEIKSILKAFKHDNERVIVILGAETRHRSIFKGVAAIELKQVCGSVNPDVVMIHDGVRPFVPLEIMEVVAAAAKEHGASGAVRPLVSTVVKPGECGFLEGSLERVRYRNSEMPQAFRYEVIKKAYSLCSDYDFDHGTECLELALKYSNVKAKLVEGPDCLWKITHQKDLIAAEEYLKRQPSGISVTKCANTFADELVRALEETTEIKCMEGASTHIIITDMSSTQSIPAISMYTMSTVSIIHVLFLPHKDMYKQLRVQLEDDLSKLSDESSGCNVYCLMVKGGVDGSERMKKIVSILSMLIKDRNSTLSGQLLVV